MTNEPQPPEFTDYSAWAGRLVFPTSPTDLTDPGKCPACLQPLRGATICPACRLDLNHPSAADLRNLSTQAAQTLLDRANLIGRMRYETHQRLAERAAGAAATANQTAPVPPTAPAAAAAAAAPAAAAASPAPAVPEPVATAQFAPIDDATPTATQASAPSTAGSEPVPGEASTPERPRRSTVQVTLLVIGVSLLSIAAIFFLIYAFIMFGLVWRSLIIGGITLAAIVAASMLKARNLGSTAEGIAVFGVVLIYLDAWALKANNMLRLGSVDDTLYWGITLTASAFGFMLWHRRTLLRAPNIAAFASLAPGLGLLAAGLAADAPNARQAFIGYAAAGIAGLLHVVTRHRRLERTVLLTLSLGATILAAFLAPWASSQPGSYGYGPFMAAGVAAIVLWSLIRTRSGPVFAILFAVVTGATLASAAALGGVRIDSEEFWLFAPLTGAAVVTIIGEHLWRRSTGHARPPLSAATISAGAVAGITALPPLFVTGFGTLLAAAQGPAAIWALDTTGPVGDALPSHYPWALAALTTAALLAILASTINKTLSLTLPIALWALALVTVSAVPLLGRLDATVSGWLALATLALAALWALRYRPPVRARYRAVLATVAGTSITLALALSWGHIDLWWITTLVTIALLLFSRMLTRAPQAKAALTGAAATLALLTAGSVAARLTNGIELMPQVELVNYVTLTCIAAALLLLASAVPIGRAWSALDRRVVFWLAFGVSILAFSGRALMTAGAPSGALESFLLPEWLTSLALSLALLAALALWVFLPGNKNLRAERIAASITATPALYLVVTAFTRAVGLPAELDAIAPITAALLGAAVSLALTVTRPTSVPRWARETGVALVAAPALTGALRTDNGLAWLALVLAGVTALLLAIDKTGLFASTSPRRHYGWAALALGTFGLWWRLRGDEVTALEPYVLPLAGALIVISLLIARAQRHAETGSLAAPAIALAGALVALVPLGINGATGALERPVVVAAASTLLLLVGSHLIAPRRQHWLDAASLAGVTGLAVTVVGRAALTRDAVQVDAWVAALLIVLIIAAFGQARTRVEHANAWRHGASVGLVIAALTAVLLLEAPQLDLRLGTVRAIAVLALFALVHLAAFVADLKPLNHVVGWVAIAYAALIGIVGTIVNVLDPLELATVPIAAALLTTGAHRLASVPEARSWPWLAPGLIVLLVPSLLATAQESPLWRLVALGVAAIAVLVVGVAGRLKAPFVIGSAVVLWHGIATLQPQLRAVYEAVPWWLWLGAGGILLIVLAARYEKRIAGLKSAAMRFAALR